ncbi:acyl-coenzyme A synthetase ACSM3, mitochondrial-like isoform X2 [Gigantopelta aegis]|uniref:acyl-coenzyme A synthetase ACSM3, mitochondrial-like isoform X2 n=1 Tax=Gigantopelta aegis TaxID=1735272 RepID=UPI001B887D2D|nr:acyl-coenzyme A synthetase ACSM3, mitochondrial-like isoform X2 [Gigantopelta aegis]
MLCLVQSGTGLVPKLTRHLSTFPGKVFHVCQIRKTSHKNDTLWRWVQGRASVLFPLCRRFAAYPPLGDYQTEKKLFKMDVPHRFNFARDVIDKWTQAEITGKRTTLPAFWWISSTKPEVKWSFQDLSRLSQRVANVLTGVCGLTRGDIVIIILPRVPEWWLINLAAIRAGIITVCGTTMLKGSDIKHRLLASKAKCIITNPATADQVEQVADESPHLTHRVVVGPKSETRPGWLNFHELDEKSTDVFECVDTRSDEPMSIFFTSGTTDSPKMTEHTHASYGIGHAVTARYLDLGQLDIFWCVSDTGWAKAAYSNLFAPWIVGTCVFIDEMEQKVDPERILKILSQYPVTHICNAPTTMRTMVTLNLKAASFINLQVCISAGEPVTLTCSTLMTDREESMGKALPGYDMQIVDDDGNVVERGTEGNIGIRVRPHRPVGLFSRYVNDPEKTASCYRGDFYLTGDRAFMDEDSFIFFIGRTDDVIISAGYRIGPFEVESALLTHPAVIESAAVSSPHDIRGQIVTAFVVRTPNYESMDEATLTKELQDHVKTATAPYKYPRKIVFVKELPKTVSGKIRRIDLRSRAWNDAKKKRSS